jgi:hypothetical protein
MGSMARISHDTHFIYEGDEQSKLDFISDEMYLLDVGDLDYNLYYEFRRLFLVHNIDYMLIEARYPDISSYIAFKSENDLIAAKILS